MAEYITNDCGNYWNRYCECGKEMSIMRPGDARCIVCYDKKHGDQWWFWTDEWQAKEREVDEDIAAGRIER